jgi:hypothetical protein
MNTEWLKAAGIRALKTFAQALAVFLVGDKTGIADVSWPRALSLAGAMALASVLTSIAGLPELPEKANKPLDQQK